jgi:hypothetical protein
MIENNRYKKIGLKRHTKMIDILSDIIKYIMRKKVYTSTQGLSLKALDDALVFEGNGRNSEENP